MNSRRWAALRSARYSGGRLVCTEWSLPDRPCRSSDPSPLNFRESAEAAIGLWPRSEVQALQPTLLGYIGASRPRQVLWTIMIMIVLFILLNLGPLILA